MNNLTYLRNRTKIDDIFIGLANAAIVTAVAYGFTALTSFNIAQGNVEESPAQREEYEVACTRRKLKGAKLLGNGWAVRMRMQVDTSGQIITKLDTFKLSTF